MVVDDDKNEEMEIWAGRRVGPVRTLERQHEIVGVARNSNVDWRWASVEQRMAMSHSVAPPETEWDRLDMIWGLANDEGVRMVVRRRIDGGWDFDNEVSSNGLDMGFGWVVMAD